MDVKNQTNGINSAGHLAQHCLYRWFAEVFQIQIQIHYHKCILDTDTKYTIKMYLDTDTIIKVSRYKIHKRYIIIA